MLTTTMSMALMPCSARLPGVRRVVSASQDAGVDLGVVRLDLPADEAGHVGQLGNGLDLDAGLGQHGTRAVGGIDLDGLVKQLARKIGDAGAIRDREQGSHSVSSSLLARRHGQPARESEYIGAALWR